MSSATRVSTRPPATPRVVAGQVWSCAEDVRSHEDGGRHEDGGSHEDGDLSGSLRIVVAGLGRRLRVERPVDVLSAGELAVLGTLRGGGPVQISALAQRITGA